MKRLLLLLLLFSASRSFAQDSPIPDTLDWRQYYPLQIGNIWEYEWDNFPLLIPDYQRLEIVGDTLINDIVYFVQEEHFYDADLAVRHQREQYLRYDSTFRRVLEYSESHLFTGESPYGGACDLGADFGQIYTCPEGNRIGIQGDYCGPDNVCGTYLLNSPPYTTLLGDTIAVAAIKGFFHLAGPGVSLAHGVGEIGGQSEGGTDGRYLIYLRLDGREYGSSTVSTSIETESWPNPFAISSVYPNPFQSRATVEFTMPVAQRVTVEIFNLLGQAMSYSTITASANTKIAIDGRPWPSGIYFLRIVDEYGRSATRTLILQR